MEPMAAPGTKIEMVTLSNATANKDDVHEQQARLQAKKIRILEEKVHSLIDVNGGLRQELANMKSRQEKLQDNQEKVDALVLQLEFEQKRIVEHEASLKKSQQELHEAVEERDAYRMKLAIQADQIAKQEKELSVMEKQLEEIGRLRFALSVSERQVQELKKASREKENQRLLKCGESVEGAVHSNVKSVLTAQNGNVPVKRRR